MFVKNEMKSYDLMNLALALGVGFLFIAAILTEFQQEDAYIYFRTAQNLAIFSDYSYNVGEKYPGATSYLYAFILASNFFIFGDFAIITIQIMNCSIAIFSAILLSKLSYGLLGGGETTKQLSFWIVGTSSPLVVLGTSGMETSFLLFSLSAMLFSAFYEKKLLLLFATTLFPLLRIEASVAPLLLILIGLVSYNKNWIFCSLIGLTTGIVLFLYGNFLLSGNIFPQTIAAKNISYEPSREIIDIIYRIFDIWFRQNYLLGIPSKFLVQIVPPMFGIISILICTILIYSAIGQYKEKTVQQQKSSLIVLLIIFLILAFVIGYCIGGVSFSWYYWPSGVLLYLLLSLSLIAYVNNKYIIKGIIISLAFLSILNLISLSNTGYKFNNYFAEIGRFINKKSSPKDTLFLEPAGFIPFYASIHTWDTVGLVSPDILEYRKQYETDWWIKFIQDKKPTWIIERQPIHNSGYPDGNLRYKLNKQNQKYFLDSYDLIRHFEYNDMKNSNKEFFSALYEFGKTSDFYLYKHKY